MMLMPRDKNGPKMRVNAIHNAKLMACFVEPCSIYEAAEHTGLHYNTVREYVKALVNEKLFFRSGRSERRDLFQWGPGRADAFRRRTPVERQQTLRRAAREREQMLLLGQARIPT